MSEATIEVPADLVESFHRQIRNRVVSYAEGAASEGKSWSRRTGAPSVMREDLDRHLRLSLAAVALSDQIDSEAKGKASFTGDAWVLSDVADAVLMETIDRARTVAFESPVEYDDVRDLAALVAGWSVTCERLDRASAAMVA